MEGALMTRTAGTASLADAGATSRIRFVNNNATAILVDDKAEVNISGDVLLKNNTDRCMSILSDGRAFVSRGVIFESNTAGLGASGNSHVSISDGVAFINNQPSGGLAAYESASVVIRNGVLFSGNVGTRGDGGALYAGADSDSGDGHNIIVNISDGVKFDYNYAPTGGGGGLAAGLNATVNINGHVIFSRNGVGTGAQGSNRWNGGGLIAMKGSRVIIGNGAVFSQNVLFGFSGSGAGLAAQDGASVTMSGVTFTGNIATGTDSCGGGFALLGNSTVDVIGDVVLESNFASAGGGVCVNGTDNANMSLAGLTMVGNQATGGSGGGLMLKGNASVEISDGSVIQNCTSRLAGAGLSVGEGAKLSLMRANIRWNNVTGALGGGLNVEGGAEAFFDSVIFTNNTAASPASADIYGGPRSKLVFSPKSGTKLDRFNDNVLWLREDCSRGEIYKAGYCQQCPQRTYSLYYNESDPQKCWDCPSRADCPGGDKLVPTNDTWHSSNDSPQMHICPQKGVCVTARDSMEGSCAKGYGGPVCGACQPEYGSHGPFRCKKCMLRGKTIALYLCGALGVVLFLSFQVHTTLSDNKEGVVFSHTAGTSAGSVVNGGARPSDFLKILVRHVQYLCILSTLNLQWPKALSAVFAAVSWLMSFGSPSPEVLSLDCLFTHPSEDGDGGTPMAMKRALVYLLAPVAFFVVIVAARLLVVALCSTSCRRRRGAAGSGGRSGAVVVASIQSVVCVGFLVVLMFFYPSLVQGAVGMFACLRLDGHNPDDPASDQYAVANATHGYWVYYIQQPCFGGWHNAWALGLGVPCTLLFCLCVPLSMFLVLCTNRSKQGVTGKFQECVGFLYHTYRPRCDNRTPALYHIEKLKEVRQKFNSSVVVYNRAFLKQMNYIPQGELTQREQWDTWIGGLKQAVKDEVVLRYHKRVSKGTFPLLEAMDHAKTFDEIHSRQTYGTNPYGALRPGGPTERTPFGAHGGRGFGGRGYPGGRGGGYQGEPGRGYGAGPSWDNGQQQGPFLGNMNQGNHWWQGRGTGAGRGPPGPPPPGGGRGHNPAGAGRGQLNPNA